MPKIIATVVFLFLSICFAGLPAKAEQSPAKTIDVYIFTEQGCPFCANVQDLLNQLKSTDYPEMNINDFDLKTHPEYLEKYLQFAKAYNIQPKGVPVTYIGDKAINGNLPGDIRMALAYYKNNFYPNPDQIVKEYIAGHPTINSDITASDKNKQLIGWVVLGIIAIGGGVFVFNKLF